MLRFSNRTRENAAALDHLRHCMRLRFDLSADDTVMISELACNVPGCPPVETHVAFWTAAGRHHFKIFKPIMEVNEDDLPPAFMKNALVALEGFECACC